MTAASKRAPGLQSRQELPQTVTEATMCNLHDHGLPIAAFDTPLVCGQCRGEIPPSAALSFEGSDYVRHFCGESCLAEWCRSTGKRGLQGEAARIAFLLARDGRQATMDWVKRTLAIYRNVALNPGHFASDRAYQQQFLASCVDFERWLATNE